MCRVEIFFCPKPFNYKGSLDLFFSKKTLTPPFPKGDGGGSTNGGCVSLIQQWVAISAVHQPNPTAG